MNTIDKKDIQGFLLKGYGKMRHSRYCLLRIENKSLAQEWIRGIFPKISDGNHNPETVCLNLALTCAGLKALGLSDDNVRNFGREFREGMGEPHKQRILADFDSSAPDQWRWGGNAKGDRHDEKNIHLLVMVFGKTSELLHEFYTELEKEFLQKGLSIIENLDGQLDKNNKEHFGFKDGIAQPLIEGIDETGNKDNTVAAGEFILGYKNEYGVYPESPLITSPQGDMHLLATDQDGTNYKDLGYNGSYLVYRQMAQNVDLFWSFMNEKSRAEDGTINEKESIRLASKMIGRWPSGAPLVKYPLADPGVPSNDNDFGYADADKEGHRCPFGAHIRRSNPRDAFEDNKEKLSIKLTKKHRILRRGRSYGEAYTGTPTHHKPMGEVGIHFMCFNANIENQFEFIQHTWCNFSRFQNLYNDPDPISGTLENKDNSLLQNFTIQGDPVSQTIEGLPQFVSVKGGAYFFFPSMSAIKYLSSL